MTTTRKQIIILVAGFGGLYTAPTLVKLLRPADAADVMLVNNDVVQLDLVREKHGRQAEPRDANLG